MSAMRDRTKQAVEALVLSGVAVPHPRTNAPPYFQNSTTFLPGATLLITSNRNISCSEYALMIEHELSYMSNESGVALGWAAVTSGTLTLPGCC